MGNNPISFIDADGDSTRYVNKKGATLFLSHDGLEDAIVVVNWKDLNRFKNDLAKEQLRKNFDPNSNDLNTKLRTGKYGNVYATENLELLWKNSKDRYVTGEPKFDPKNPDKEAKLHPEFGSKLYKGVDGVVRADGHFYESSSALINWDNVVNNSDCGILVGDAHTHPNEGARFIFRNAQNPQGLGGSFSIDQASSFDKGHWSNGYSENHPKNYFDIIIQNGTYKFYNKDESFDVPRNFK